MLVSAWVAMNWCLLPSASGASIHVTNDYPTIQAAIDAANSNDTILVQAGTYREALTITNSVHLIGSSSTNCLVHHTNDVLITITSAGPVELSGLGINGGEVAFGGGFSPSVPRGIVATNTTLILNDVTVDTTRNFAVTVVNGSLYATNVALYTRDLLEQWDVGFQLNGCFARFYQLTQTSGQIDHTININNPPATFSDVRVENCIIQASHLGYGECVRTYTSSAVVITNCYLFRAAGGQAVSIGNQAIGVNGYSNTVWITGNRIDNVPTGIRVFGSLPNSNAIKIEHNEITNCASNGVLASSMSYEGIDMGGGPFGSAGQNYFSNPGARDVELSSASGNMHAISNCWTYANPDDGIFDQLDSGVLGRVTSSPTFCEVVSIQCSLVPDIITNVVGLADSVVATVLTNNAAAVGALVDFSVTSGPNTGKGTNATTDVSGQASFTYTSNGTNGTDNIQAIATAHGVSSTGTATKVWINATVPPTIGCPSNITTNNATGLCGRSLAFSVTTNGTPAPAVVFTIGTNVIASPYLFACGTTTVTCTASNIAGTNVCSFDVTVDDTELPSITCPADVVTNVPYSQTNAVIGFSSPVASDNCALASSSCSPPSGSAFPVGTNIVTCTAVDTAGNTNTCTFSVTVNRLAAPDTNAPSLAIASPSDYQAFTNAAQTVSGTADDSTGIQDVTVNGAVASVVGTNWSKGVTLSPGTNSLTVIATDSSANQNAATQTVHAILTAPSSIDTNAPSIQISSPANAAEIAVTSVDVSGNASDDSGVAGIIVTNSRGGSIDAVVVGTNWTASSLGLRLGTNQLFAVATDVSNNVSSANVTVIRINTNYVDTTLRTTTASLNLGSGPNADSIKLSGVFNDSAFRFDPTNDAVEIVFGDYDASVPSNSVKALKFKAKASPTNTLTALSFSLKKRTFTFSASGFTLTNGDPFLVAISYGTNDLGPDSIRFSLPVNPSGKFAYAYGTPLPDVDQFFLGKSQFTTNSFNVTGTLNVLGKPSALMNPVSFGIGSFEESLATNGWTRGNGNVYLYIRPISFVGAVQKMTLNFDLGTWSATGSGANLSFLLVSPDADIRLEIADFAASYSARLIQKGAKFSY